MSARDLEGCTRAAAGRKIKEKAADLCAKSTEEKMKIKFKLYSWRAKFRQKEAPLFRLKAIFHEDSVDLFIHLPLFTVGVVIHERRTNEEEKNLYKT